MTVRSGREILADYLARDDRQEIRFASASREEFRSWLAARIVEQQRNPEFVQQCRIRELVREHRDELDRREQMLRQVRSAYAASPQRDRIDWLAARLIGLEKAVDGLSAAVEERRADPQKLADYRAERDRLRTELRELSRISAEKTELDRAEADWIEFREQIGLSTEETRLDDLRRQRGGRLVTSGRRFESEAERAVRELVVPTLPPMPGTVEYLTGLTLGVARAELDGVLLTLLPGTDTVAVLALVEAKRNINDIAHGFRIRQENLAWFTGDHAAYDVEAYRTRTYTTGHFDRPAFHTVDDRWFRFEAGSFQGFQRDARTGHFLRGLYFVVEDRPLIGVSSRELGRIMHRVATDPDFDLASESVIRRYHAWVRSTVHRFQARDVLELYAADETLARQIVFVIR